MIESKEVYIEILEALLEKCSDRDNLSEEDMFSIADSVNARHTHADSPEVFRKREGVTFRDIENIVEQLK